MCMQVRGLKQKGSRLLCVSVKLGGLMLVGLGLAVGAFVKQ